MHAKRLWDLQWLTKACSQTPLASTWATRCVGCFGPGATGPARRLGLGSDPPCAAAVLYNQPANAVQHCLQDKPFKHTGILIPSHKHC